MQAGIGLPSYIPNVGGPTLASWAAAADDGPFASLSLIDKLTYSGFDPLIALAGAATVTKRVRLITTVLLASLWEPVRLAKQAASLDVLSGGRLTLGVSSGGGPADYAATGYQRNRRGKRLDQILETLHRVWRGELLTPESTEPIGPSPVQPGGPPILIGAVADVAIDRVGRFADGFIASGRAPQPERAPVFAQKVRESWQRAGRSGAPVLKKAAYYALGPNAVERSKPFMRAYYGPMADDFLEGIVTTPEGVRDVMSVYEAAGYDEICFWPTTTDQDQLDRLAAVVG